MTKSELTSHTQNNLSNSIPEAHGLIYTGFSSKDGTLYRKNDKRPAAGSTERSKGDI